MNPILIIKKIRLLALISLIALAIPLSAKVFFSKEEALKKHFHDAKIVRKTIFLTKDQLAQAEQLAGKKIPSALLYSYKAWKENQFIGTAYFDTHRVRTLPETLMVIIDPRGKIQDLEVLSFKEPQEYLPRKLWYEQFQGKSLSKKLYLGQEINAISGATLTARATTQAVRRSLALYQTLETTDKK